MFGQYYNGVNFRRTSESNSLIKSRVSCPTCGVNQVPWMSVSSTHPLRVRVFCEKCCREWYTTLEELKSESLEEKDSQTPDYCSKHKEMKNDFYCQECSVNFCEKCFEEHAQFHKEKIISFSELPLKQSVIEKVEKMKQEFLTLNKKLQNTCTDRLKKEMQRVCDIFEENKEVNLKLFEYIELLANNYNSNNYETILNLSENSKFKIKNIDPALDNENIITKVKSQSLIEIDSDFITEIKKIKERREKERREQERKEKERREQEKREQEKREQERREQERKEQERKEKERKEQERKEKERRTLPSYVNGFRFDDYQYKAEDNRIQYTSTKESKSQKNDWNIEEDLFNNSMEMNNSMDSGSLDQEEDPFSLEELKEKHVFKQHSYPVNCICVLQDMRLASCSNDCSIRIINMQTYKVDLTIKEHDNWVYYITVMDNGNLISGCRDGNMKIFRISKDDYSVLYNLNGRDPVLKVIEVSRGWLCSCFKNGLVSIWKFQKDKYYEERVKINTKSDAVKSIIEFKNKEYLGLCDSSSFIVYNMKTSSIIGIVENVYCSGSNSLLEVSKNRILVGEKNEVAVIDSLKFTFIKRVYLSRASLIYSFLKVNKSDILCGTSKGILFLLDEENLETLEVKQCHNNAILDMVLINDYTLVTCGRDSVIKVWSTSEESEEEEKPRNYNNIPFHVEYEDF